MKKIYLIILILLAIHFSVSSQDLTFYGFLPSYSQTGLISKKLDYNFFISATNSAVPVTYRGINYPAKLLQVYIQPSIIYKYSVNLNFAASITYNYQRSNPDANYFNEWRGWQQVVYGLNPFKYKGRLTNRLRFEERYIKNIADVYRLTTRLRYQIGYMVPLEGKTLDPHEFYFNTYYEIYFSLSNPSSRPRNALHSEDWAYAGIGYNTGKLGRVEIGPLFQTNVRDRQHERRNLALLQILWVTNFNLKKKTKQ